MIDPGLKIVLSRTGWGLLLRQLPYLVGVLIFVFFLIAVATRATAAQTPSTSALAQSAFAAVCTNPGQTHADVMRNMTAHVVAQNGSGLPFTVDFYDTTLEATGAAITPGTNRRCAVSWPGNDTAAAVQTLLTAMQGPPVFGTPTDMPEGFAAKDGTAFIQARLLNARGTRAVVHVGTRTGARGLETFINVERLPPPAN